MAYATLAEFQQYTDKTTVTAAETAAITAYLNAATLNIDRAINCYHQGLEFFKAPAVATARLFAGNGRNYLRLPHCIAVTAVQQRGAATALWENITDYTLARGSERAPEFEPPYTLLLHVTNIFPASFHGYPIIQVTARWGFSASPPADIVAACIEQAARWFKRAQSAEGDTLASGELGMLLYRQVLDPDIRRKLIDGRYMRPALGTR